MGDVGSVEGLVVELDVLSIDIVGTVFGCVDGEGFVICEKEGCTFEKWAAENVRWVARTERVETEGVEDVPSGHFAVVFIACEAVGIG